MKEQEKTTKTGIAQLAGTIVKHELSKNKWPQILEFLSHLLSSQDILTQEVRIKILFLIFF